MTKEEGRRALRLSTDVHDDEIEALIQAAQADLATAGIGEDMEEKTPLYNQAVTAYLRAYFWPEGEVAGKSAAIYENIKSGMKLTGLVSGNE